VNSEYHSIMCWDPDIFVIHFVIKLSEALLAFISGLRIHKAVI